MSAGSGVNSKPEHVAREARLIVRGALKGALATNRRAARPQAQGHPYVSKVGVAADQGGAPVFLFSTLAAHTQDLLADPRASLLVEAPTTASNPLEGTRCTLVGRVKVLSGFEADAVRAAYLLRHPGAARYAGFGDFAPWRMHVEKVHFVGGFGRAKWFKGADYSIPAPDLAGVQAEILEVLNGKKSADICALAAHAMGRSVGRAGRGWRAIGLDADGLCLCNAKGMSVRVDFVSAAHDIRAWKSRLQTMLKRVHA